MIEVAQLIESLGLPTFFCVGMAWYLSKKDKERIELDKAREEKAFEDRMKLVESIEHYRNSSNEILKTNSEMAETNRLLANEINRRIENIEDTVKEIKNTKCSRI